MPQNFSPRDTVLMVVLGFLLLAGLIQGQAGIILLLALIAGVYFFRNQIDFGGSSTNEVDAPVVIRREAPPQQQPENPVYKHAIEAVRRVGLEPEQMQVLPVDIGLLSFHGDLNPVIHRLQDIENDADYVQPYVQLRVPVTAKGKIRFEVLDKDGKLIYVYEDNYQLKRGRNLIVPTTRLPIHDEHPTNGRWQMRVYADGTLIARHLFGWGATENEAVRPPVEEDGEISNEMRELLAENRLQRMSLDELLAPQDDEEDNARQQRR
ncbi:MAG: DUF2892 domain-containing protein [Chitinophagaceae bacterium]|nr:DUF2892 domain-containing protein [Anaerolineae bacterium]